MYENVTYEEILQRMLNRIPSTMDKREGSIIYDALAPAAVELQLMYIELDVILTETFGDTASREYLIRRAAERGLSPTEATYAILKGVFNIDIAIGSRFNCEDLNYIAIEKIADGQFKMKCETLGVSGNKNFGNLIPIDYIEGLESAQLTELLIPGEDEEDTEVFRNRYFDSFDTKPYGGNVSDYLMKTNSLPGVGSTKVTPVWEGGGTVKLTILNSEFNKASSTLIETVQEEIDPTKDGSGVGIAPIGHTVTVDTVENVTVNVSATFTFDTGYTWQQLQAQAAEKLADYMLELREDWADQSVLIVRIAQLETRFLSIEGIIDVSGTSINGEASNLSLTAYQVPVEGIITSA